ncbi:MAG: putative porin [Nitrospinota bacterium]|nr:putative porin [Nitrospinota bacterium]
MLNLHFRIHVFAFVMMFALLAGAGNSFAEKTVWKDGDKKLDLLGDLRFRYEVDNNESKTGDNSMQRTRERVRLRIGGVYSGGPNVEAGFRLATGSNDLHSPHQTLSDGPGEAKALGNANFGTDKAYVKFKSGGFWTWAGKNSLPTKQILETWIDGDFNPGGIALGYNAVYNEARSGFSVGRFTVANNDHKASNDIASLITMDHGRKIGNAGIKLTVASLIADETDRDPAETLTDIPGGDATYNYLGTEVKIGLAKVGIEYMLSDVKVEERGGDNAKSPDTSGLVAFINLRLMESFGIRYCYYDIGYASVPLMGTWAQDDFPNSSNFTGSKIQFDIYTQQGATIDIRLYEHKTKNELITTDENTNALSGKTKISRTQVNVNVAF